MTYLKLVLIFQTKCYYHLGEIKFCDIYIIYEYDIINRDPLDFVQWYI